MKRIVILLLILQSFIRMAGQQTGESFILNEPVPPNQTREWIASRYIDMIPDFSAAPEPGKYVRAAIDPMMVFPPWDGQEGGPPDNNMGGGVGTLPGELTVTPTGAAVYSIPIEVPEGIANLAPELKFVYNSQAGDGIMGACWYISGLSRIARVPFTYYYNGFTGAVALNNGDQLMLDGNYLRKVSENTYRTELETFAVIAQIGNSINDGFVVKRKNGLIYEYGTTEDSKYYLQAGNPIAWYLSKIKDLNGNYIEFHYINNRAKGSLYPDYILYTGNENKNQAPLYKLLFGYMYGERQDTPRKYFTNPDNPAPVYSRIIKQLATLSIIYLPSNTEIKFYQLEYSNDNNGIPYLTGIFPNYDYNNERSWKWFNHTKFEWLHNSYNLNQDSVDRYLRVYDETSTFKQLAVFSAQFDDDPRSDLLHVSKTSYNNKYFIKAYINQSKYYEGGFDFKFSGEEQPYVYLFDDGRIVLYIAPGDFNGDGKDEILCVYKQHNDGNVYLGISHFDNNGNYIEDADILLGYLNQDPYHPPFYLIGDFSGNGYDDLCIIDRAAKLKSYATCRIILSYTDEPLSTVLSNNSSIMYPYKVLKGDFNGNGKTELLTVEATSCKIISLTADNNQIIITSTSDDFCIATTQNNDIVAADFNNDAKTDVLLLKSGNTNNWQFYYSYGKGMFAKQNAITSEQIGAHNLIKFAADLNGDQHSDLCLIKKVSGNGGIEKYYREDFIIKPNSQSVTITPVEYGAVLTSVSSYQEKPEVDFSLGNFSGNSANQIMVSRVVYGNGTPPNLFARFILSAPVYFPHIDAIEKITNGVGEVKKIHYLPHLSMPVYNGKINNQYKSKELTFPLVNYTGILNVVTSIEQEVDMNEQYESEFLTVEYLYYGPKYHKLGKGFLGFDIVWQIDHLKGTTTKLSYDINNTWFHAVNNEIEVRSNDQFQLISKTNKEYAFRDMGDDDHLRYYPYLKNKIVKTYNMEPDIVHRYYIEYEQLDDWGNPEIITEKWGGGSSGWPVSKTIETRYLNLHTSHIHKIGLIDRRKTTYKKTNKPDVIRLFDNDYYETTTGFLKKETIEPDDEKSYSKNYEYDNFGNLVLSKLSARGMEDRITQTVFSDDGRFLVQKINPKGHTNKYTYYEQTGLLKTSTDVNNLTTTYHYDIFGRLEKEELPDGNLLVTVRRWSMPNTADEHEDAPRKAYYYEWKKRTGSPVELTFFDQFQREVRKVSKGFHGENIYIDKEYLGKYEYRSGLLYHVSLPYYASEDPMWIHTLYDKLRRTIRVNRPDGAFKTIIYSGNTKTTKNFDDQISKTEYNGAGWLVKTTDNNTTPVEYTYYSNGLVEDVVIHNNQQTKIHKTYDIFGRVLTLTDPDKGTTTYEYNAFGEQLRKTDQLFQTTLYQYDKLGRLIYREAPDATTQWEYDTQNFGIGKLHAVAHAPADGHVKLVVVENEYTPFGRLKKQSQTINGSNQLAYIYDYDIYGRKKHTKYPSGYQLSNNYNEYGYPVNISDSKGHILWAGEAMNASGKFTLFKLGNNIRSGYDYDIMAEKITGIRSGTGNSNENLQNLHYDWLTNGNLDSRTDANKEITESFYYDNFNRLTNADIKNNPQLSVTFDNYGRITEKSDVGIYTYGVNAGPNAVTGIDRVPETISTEMQEVTYTSFDKVMNLSEDEKNLEIDYGYNHLRVWQQIGLETQNANTTKRYFNSLFELVNDQANNEKQIHYLTGPTGLFAIFTIENGEVETLNFILKDHLGSLTHVLDQNGNLLEEQNFDAWGRRRNPQTWTYHNVPETHLFDRGYTMHEHLDAFKLINMNGRMYDPVVGRFLSVDPFVQFPEYSQSYNRYTYALNNPLKYTDPSGFFLDWFINEKTGDIYYNSTYGKNDAGKIEGKGWVWFGDDDVFGDNAYSVIWQNKYLLSDYHEKNKTYNKSIIRNDSKLVGFNVEASFKGQNALTFMKKMGYEFKPVLYKYHYDVTTYFYPEPHDQISQTFDKSAIDEKIKSQYIPSDWFLKNTIIHGYYGQKYKRDIVSYGFVYSIEEQSWEVRENIYGEHAFGKKAGRILKTINDIFPWKSWLEEYWKRRYK